MLVNPSNTLKRSGPPSETIFTKQALCVIPATPPPGFVSRGTRGVGAESVVEKRGPTDSFPKFLQKNRLTKTTTRLYSLRLSVKPAYKDVDVSSFLAFLLTFVEDRIQLIRSRYGVGISASFEGCWGYSGVI